MPSVAVHDMRVQPQRHDLLVATHGRGFWILDDLNAIGGLTAALDAGVPKLFEPRTAYTWYRWWTSDYGTHPDECCVAVGAYSGENPDDGASLTYYLPRPARSSIEFLDARGGRIRCLDAPDDAGLHRTAWDLKESPPVPWLRAREWNRGGDGATVVPGRYTVRLQAGANAVDQPLEVRADPRAEWTQSQYVARYEFVKSLDDELSAIDVALNRLDSLSVILPSKDDKAGTFHRDLNTVYSTFTSGVVNSEDDQLMPDSLRERLTILQGVVALSQGPPLPPHYREAAAIHARFEKAMGAYREFLAKHNLPLDPKPGDCSGHPSTGSG